MAGGEPWVNNPYVSFPYMSGSKLPFAAQQGRAHISLARTRGASIMNWIFEAFSGVYSTATFGSPVRVNNAATANDPAKSYGAQAKRK
jgi:hypothetical protein